MLLSIGASEATSVSQKLLDRDILSFNKQLAIQCLGRKHFIFSLFSVFVLCLDKENALIKTFQPNMLLFYSF